VAWPAWTRAFGLALAVWLLAATGASASGAFSNWAAIVVAGDWHAHSGEPSEVFDNARRDLTKAFIGIGVSPANISQFSVRPERYTKEAVLKSAPQPVYDRLMTLAKQAPDGCLIYFTSHGAPEGVMVDGAPWDPNAVGQLIDTACGSRPTVVVVSACFSGVFVPALEGPNRMILTAARPDRTSFGCGQADRYTYFDGCFLQSLPQSHDFTALASATQTCVAKLEIATHASPPSEPQLFIGAQLRPMLPLYAFQPQPSHALASARPNSTP
jgi:hypothetical protein